MKDARRELLCMLVGLLLGAGLVGGCCDKRERARQRWEMPPALSVDVRPR